MVPNGRPLRNEPRTDINSSSLCIARTLARHRRRRSASVRPSSSQSGNGLNSGSSCPSVAGIARPSKVGDVFDHSKVIGHETIAEESERIALSGLGECILMRLGFWSSTLQAWLLTTIRCFFPTATQCTQRVAISADSTLCTRTPCPSPASRLMLPRFQSRPRLH